MVPLYFHWLLVSTPSGLSAVALSFEWCVHLPRCCGSPDELINNLFPCQAERAASLALARQSCPFLWGEPPSSQSPPHQALLILCVTSVPQTPSDETSGLAGKGSCPVLPAREGFEADKRELASVTFTLPWEADGEPAAGLGACVSRGVCCPHQC